MMMLSTVLFGSMKNYLISLRAVHFILKSNNILLIDFKVDSPLPFQLSSSLLIFQLVYCVKASAILDKLEPWGKSVPKTVEDYEKAIAELKACLNEISVSLRQFFSYCFLLLSFLIRKSQ